MPFKSRYIQFSYLIYPTGHRNYSSRVKNQGFLVYSLKLPNISLIPAKDAIKSRSSRKLLADIDEVNEDVGETVSAWTVKSQTGCDFPLSCLIDARLCSVKLYIMSLIWSSFYFNLRMFIKLDSICNPILLTCYKYFY